MTPSVPDLRVEVRRLCDAMSAELEVRTPRAAFTRRLARLCERVDEASEVDVNFNPFFSGRGDQRTRRVKLQRLWAVGSYARGAPTCGDLDLVFEFTTSGGPPFPSDRDTRRALFGAPPDIRFYAGTPERNSSLVRMDGARLVWSGPGCDWRKALASIPEDATAGPALRADLIASTTVRTTRRSGRTPGLAMPDRRARAGRNRVGVHTVRSSAA